MTAELLLLCRTGFEPEAAAEIAARAAALGHSGYPPG
jgi:23S rRNA C2498 (ribose-2'-O)-methylase RlmM